MALQRYWYIDRGKGNRLAIVEKSNSSSTKETLTSNYSSVSEAKDLRLYTIDTQIDFTVDTLSSAEITEQEGGIPSRYHNALINKVISEGYEDPRNQKFDAAQYFEGKYQAIVKKAKKNSRSNMQSNGFIKQVDF